MRLRSLAVALLAGAVLCSPVGSALGQGGAQTGPSAADRETARKLLDDGDAAVEKKDFEQALKAYAAAHAIMHVPTTGIEVAKTQVALGLLVEARDTALEVSRLTTPKESAAFAAARKAADELAQQLDGKIPSLRLVLSGLAPSDAPEVTIDGTSIPAAAVSQPRRVNPGEHHVVVQAEGYLEGKADVTTSEGSETTDVTVEMKRSKVMKPTPSNPGKRGSEAKPGLSPFLPAGIAVTAVGLGVGIGTGIVALNKCHKGESCPTAIASDVGFGVAVVGAALTTVGIVFTLRQSHASTEPGRTGWSVQPMVGIGAIGLHGEF